ncbi:protein-tyrosine phosphatase-like protein [Sphaerosporella brunnea]|uniref:Protein-tyrosine phosphatase-like protein n=1 Tax=Sphaerosporella brunnea TaxID=1250544 RepID=A0A5J5EPD4_9PEZI|nr:protein-tyrosine phosphatase-like protein [Sphaerosporella brunnea]
MTSSTPALSWPWHPVPGISNLRTLGGYSTPNGKTKACVFRSAAPALASGAALQKLGIAAVYDLRSQQEAASGGEGEELKKLLERLGIEYRLVPVFDDASWSPEAMATRWARTMRGDIVAGYRDILRAGATSSFRAVLRHILERPHEPLLLHCTAGKDRTGVLCAVLLALVGVEDEVIAEEYALTSVAMRSMLASLEAVLKKREVFAKVLRERGEAVRDEGIRNMLSSEPQTMRSLLRILKEEFGGAERYVRELCGFSEEEVRRIRENLVEREV